MSEQIYYEPTTPLSEQELAAIRASSTAKCWKRACDLPAELRIEEGTCTNRGGQNLWYSAVFPPATNRSLRGVVLFLHGVNEHSGRYFHLFEELCAMDFGVIAYDLRSHGKTHMDVPKKRGHVDTFQSFVNDTNDFITFAKQQIYTNMQVATDVPFVIVGYSMGTLVTLHTVLSEQHKFDGIVLTAPLAGVEMTPFLRGLVAIGGLMVSLVPTARTVPGVNEKWVCRDPLVGQDYDADPLTVRAQLTSRTGKELGDAMDRIVQNTASFEDPNSSFTKLPILFMQGTLDKVTSIPMAKKLFERIASTDKQFIDIEGCYHVLFEDFERARVLSEIKTWLQTRFPLLP